MLPRSLAFPHAPSLLLSCTLAAALLTTTLPFFPPSLPLLLSPLLPPSPPLPSPSPLSSRALGRAGCGQDEGGGGEARRGPGAPHRYPPPGTPELDPD
eukprot:178301-Rhodomonas_salina.2